MAEIPEADISRAAANILDVSQWAEGDESHVQTMANGRQVPSPLKLITDARLYKPQTLWISGASISDATQLYESPANGQLYAPLPSSLPFTSTTDPSLDAANWYQPTGIPEGADGSINQLTITDRISVAGSTALDSVGRVSGRSNNTLAGVSTIGHGGAQPILLWGDADSAVGVRVGADVTAADQGSLFPFGVSGNVNLGRISNRFGLGAFSTLDCLGDSVLAGIVNLGAIRGANIAAGAATIVSSNVALNGEGNLDDQLDTINGGTTGAMLLLRGNGNGIITAKDDTGNLRLAGDFVMTSQGDQLTLKKEGSVWFELSRSSNG